MENIKNIIKDYKYDLFTVSILLIIFTILAFIFVGHQGNPIIDCFSSSYLSSEILKGKVLYKDLFIVYGPLSYQFNALLFLIFGEHLNTLYTAGIINSLIIITAVYLIARSIASRWVAFTVTFTVIALCVFHYYIFNYIFPYAYAMPYAFSAFLISVLFCIYYIKYSAPKFLGLSIFFIFISLSSKMDFLLFLILLITIALFLKPVPKKFLFKSLAISLIIPSISWLALFIQGLRISDLATYYYYFNKFINSPLLQFFHSNFTGLYPSMRIAELNFNFFKSFFFPFIISTVFIYPFLLLIHNKFNIIKLKFSKISQFIIIIALISIASQAYSNIEFKDPTFCWTAITSTLILFCVLFNFYKKIKNGIQGLSLKNKLKKINEEIELKDKMFLFLAIAGLTATARSYFFIDLHSFGTFYLPLILLVNIVFLINYLPDYLNNALIKFKTQIDKNIFEKTISIVFIALTLNISLAYIDVIKLGHKYPIKTEKGTFYTIQKFESSLNQAIDYINKEIPKDASFMMFPQSPVLNFLTNRPSHGWYYDLMPIIMLTFGEDKILNDIMKSPPDYIFVNNRNARDWGFPYFGKNYAFKINYFIEQNYSLEKHVGNNDFWIKIYKKNDQNYEYRQDY